MASTFKYPTNASKPEDRNGRGVVFARPGDRKRVKIKLGRVTNAAAADVCRRIESLSRCAKLHTEPSGNVVEWLAGIADSLHAKLAGHGLTEPREPVATSPRLRAWLDRYMDQRTAELKPSSIAKMRRTATALVAHFGADTPIGEITADGGADWQAALRSKTWTVEGPKGKRIVKRITEAGVRVDVRNAKTMFNAAVDRGIIPQSPFRKLASTSIAADREYLDVDASERILDALPGVQWRTLWGLARHAGLRCPSETHGITWGDVDFDKGRMRVRSPKTERYADHAERIVPITPRLRVLLLDAFDDAHERQQGVLRISRNNLTPDHDRGCQTG
ncbi:MAG: site-specific integrase [Planctomycetes bacterium]|nr:site-specific integrase [Planctomycetota bacterium]